MLLSLTATADPTTGADATDLGYVLHKHPDRVRSVSVNAGHAHVFYPEATPERCTATLYVEVDPIALTRGKGRKRQQQHGLEPYVNDRPYAASSLLSVAIGRMFGSALAGNCETKPELVEQPFELEVVVPVVPARGGEPVLRSLFEPLGYTVEATALALDEQFPQWGDSRYLSVTLKGQVPVQRCLEHLFVLLPVLDDRKHYWIGKDEVEKLLRRGSEWLPQHPETELITRRYLRFGALARDAMARLADTDGSPNIDEADASADQAEAAVERPISLNQQRLDAVTAAVLASGGGRVVDLGCGEGRLLQRLLKESAVQELLGVDVSIGALERAERRLRLDEMSERRRDRVRVVQGALTYRDSRLDGFDVATVVEVIEHLDAERLDVFAQVLFEQAAPATVIVTTPNIEYNAHFEGMAPGALRHRDHRFEWTRAEFNAWVADITERYGYTADWSAIGPDDPDTGPPTQMAVFRRSGGPG